MKFCGAVCILCLVASNGLPVPPEAAEEGRRFGQTGAKKMRIEANVGAESAVESRGQAAASARAAAEEARMEAHAAGRAQVVADSMRREGAMADRLAGETLVKQRNMEEYARKDAANARSLRIEAEREAQKEKESAEFEERSRKRAEEKSAAQEEWEAAQKFRAAQKVAADKRVAEKVYTSSMARAETEMASQLWKRAEGVRSEAEKGRLHQDDIKEVIGSSSMKDFSDLVSGLVLAASEPHFRAAVDGLRLKSSPAHLMTAIKHKTEAFVDASKGVNDKQFVPMLARFLNESQQELRNHEMSAAAIAAPLKGNAPEQLKKSLGFALGNITLRSKFVDVDTHRLARSNASKACGELARVVLNAAPHYKSLAQMEKVLGIMSKMVPQMVSDFPNTKYEVAPMTQKLLNMAYAEHTALKEASTDFITKAGPIIADRLQCTFSGATPCMGPGPLSLTLSMAAAWLML